MIDTELEPELRRRFAVRCERFQHGDFRVELLLPRSADELIDESAFDADERLPYWAELWPSARALARFLLDHPPAAPRVLELGCGVALPALALRALGRDVLATDYYEEALLFARANARRNDLAPLRTALLDWREAGGLGHFDLVVAADVLYERRNAENLARALLDLVAPGGTALFADPGRVHAALLPERMTARGWSVEVLARPREPSAAATGTPSTVTLYALARP